MAKAIGKHARLFHDADAPSEWPEELKRAPVMKVDATVVSHAQTATIKITPGKSFDVPLIDNSNGARHVRYELHTPSDGPWFMEILAADPPS